MLSLLFTPPAMLFLCKEKMFHLRGESITVYLYKVISLFCEIWVSFL